MDWSFAVQCLAAFLALLNPIGAIPLYLTLAGPREPLVARRIASRATYTVLCTLLLSAIIGQGILRFFGITIPAFRVGGGILVLLMAISMLQGRMSPAKHAPEETDELIERDSVAIVPLGIPILAGPGSISGTILLAQQATTWSRTLAMFSAVAIVTLTVFLVFRGAQRAQRFLGKTEIGIANRVMGLILAAIAIQFIADGLRELFPILAQART